MSSHLEDTLDGRPRRPRLADASASAILGAIALGLLTKHWSGALLGGLGGHALGSQRQPLEMAIREHFKAHKLDVIFFHRAPRAVKVTFSYGPNAFWTVESVLPDGLSLGSEDAEDWLYGNLVARVLPQTLQLIRPLTSR